MKAGATNNPFGRPKGVPNRLTKELRQVLKDIVAGELEQMPKLLENLEPKDRLELTIKLMAYCLPKIETVKPGFQEPMEFD